jgi:CHAD domain-containing protein
VLDHWKSARRHVIHRHAGQSAIHEWRICSRRLLALEALLGPAASRPDRSDLHTLLDAAFHATGKLRDAQLAAARLKRLATRFPAADRLHRHLQHGIPELRDRAERHVRDIRPRAVRKILQSREPLRDPDISRTESRAGLRLRRAHRQLQRAASRCRTARSLHRYRVQLKSLRYMLEFARAARLRIPAAAGAPRHLGRAQRKLGGISDLRVLIRLLDRYAAKHPAWRLESAGLRQYLHRQLQRLEPVVIAAAQ